VKLAAGLKQCDRLPEPIFTPATKAPQGEHDENISLSEAAEPRGGTHEHAPRAHTGDLQGRGGVRPVRGIIIADTKFEFGLADGLRRADPDRRGAHARQLAVLARGSLQAGGPQPSFDKQFLREYLQALVNQGLWNKQAPGPELPQEIVEGTLGKVLEARDRICT
jgi:phosphoribosylaminoimidazole-succinocarboxamide synthase